MSTHSSNPKPTPDAINGADAIDPIDRQMESASQLLAEGSYLEAALMCKAALLDARGREDFGRMARICMPMLEAQRAVRQSALDTGIIHRVQSSADIPTEPDASCYLFAPNFVGADTRRFRIAANDAGIGVFALTCEPTTSKGLWPIVGVGDLVVRVQITPPTAGTPTPDWFAHAAETLGNQAIADAQSAGDPNDPKQWIVDDFLDRLDACPEHEQFIMALAQACQDTILAPATPRKRRRGIINDPYSF